MSRMLLATSRLVVAVAFGAVSLAASAQPGDKPAEHRQGTTEGDGISLELRLRWRNIGAVVLDATNRLQFPETRGEPGIYRFELRREEDRALYIGETDNLRRRFYQYRAPGKSQQTNQRICAEIRKTLMSGSKVDVSIVEEAWFCAQAACTGADLASVNQRRLLEQLAIFSVSAGVRMLNSERVRASDRSAIGDQSFHVCS